MSGWYHLCLPEGRALPVFCDMDTLGGGWLVSVREGTQRPGPASGQFCPLSPRGSQSPLESSISWSNSLTKVDCAPRGSAIREGFTDQVTFDRALKAILKTDAVQKGIPARKTVQGRRVWGPGVCAESRYEGLAEVKGQFVEGSE